MKTALGMEETLSTIQLDFLLPERFDLTYVGEDGENNHRPVVIHRGIVSTMERFVAYLTEVYKGAFPTWLAPIQASIIPVSVEAHSDYAYEIKERLQAQGLRVEVDDRNEKWGIRSAHHKPKNFTKSLLGIKKSMTRQSISVATAAKRPKSKN